MARWAAPGLLLGGQGGRAVAQRPGHDDQPWYPLVPYTSAYGRASYGQAQETVRSTCGPGLAVEQTANGLQSGPPKEQQCQSLTSSR